jgi:ubiquinone biosynthesis protein UbiJ
MIAQLATRFLQHITQQNTWAKPHLVAFAGQVITFDFSVLRMQLIVLEDGSLATAPDNALPNATVYIPPSLAMRLVTGDEHAKTLIKVDGDVHVATEVSKVLQQMRWDIEEDISHITGDIAAYKIGEVTQSMFAQAKKQTTQFADMVSEYWQEEKPVLAKKMHVEQFNQSVDTLRHDVERFEKKLEKLAQQVKDSQEAKPDSVAARKKASATKPKTPKESS